MCTGVLPEEAPVVPLVPKEVRKVESPRTGVKDGVSHHVDARNQTEVPRRVTSAPNC